MGGIQKTLENVKNPIFANGNHKITYGFMDSDYGSAHYGADIVPGLTGIVSDVIAIEDGVVVYVKTTVKNTLDISKKSSWNSPDALGNNIKIRHENGSVSRYCHLAYGSIRVTKGDVVKKGQIIATIGNTGLSSAPHVHFEIWKNANLSSSRVDPLPYLLGEKILIKQALKTEKYKVNCAALNVRAAPTISASIVGDISLRRGAVVAVYEGTETTADNLVWVKVGYSSPAWIAKKYLTKI